MGGLQGRRCYQPSPYSLGKVHYAPAAVLPFYEELAPWVLEERARTYRGPSSRRWRWSARASLDGGEPPPVTRLNECAVGNYSIVKEPKKAANGSDKSFEITPTLH